MVDYLSREQIEDLLGYIGSDKIRSFENNDNIQCCCPIHGENNPSMGVSVEKQQFNCFSCHESGSIPWLVYKALDLKSFRQALEILKERYNVSLGEVNLDGDIQLPTYEELKKVGNREEDNVDNYVHPKKSLFIYKSGKETYKTFFDRGFTQKTMQEFLIGRDVINKTITIPLFDLQGNLKGYIGRYINPNRPKNSRYKIYDNTSTGDILYPLHRFKPVDKSVILVEGILDALWLHQLGFTNALATLTNSMSKKQAKIICPLVDKFIDFSDNDTMGNYATNSYPHRMKGKSAFTVKHLYPKNKKDPQECTYEEIKYMLDNKELELLMGLHKI